MRFDFARVGGLLKWTSGALVGLAATFGALFFLIGWGDAKLEIADLYALPTEHLNIGTRQPEWTLYGSFTVRKAWGVAVSDCQALLNGNPLGEARNIDRFASSPSLNFVAESQFYSIQAQNTFQLRCGANVSNLIRFRVNEITPQFPRQEF